MLPVCGVDVGLICCWVSVLMRLGLLWLGVGFAWFVRFLWVDTIYVFGGCWICWFVFRFCVRVYGYFVVYGRWWGGCRFLGCIGVVVMCFG